MMNEFPRDFPRPWQEIADNFAGVAGCNGTEYLELLAAAGIKDEDLPACQPAHQHQIWQLVPPATATPDAVANAIELLKTSNDRFHLDGSSWTNHLSWVRGYDREIDEMYRLSGLFHQQFDPIVTADPTMTNRTNYRSALLYNLLLQTSCFRYWGQGVWTEYARELYRRGTSLLG
jgi:hypothetical protein